MNTIKVDSKHVKMVAHRGVSKLEKENTCAAFIAAGNRSYFGIETDVHVSKDGKFVICHDETLTRVSNETCDINIEKTNYADYADVVLPDIDGSTYRKDIKVPLLEEYIKICKKYEKVCVLEVKNLFSENDIQRLVEAIKSYDYLESVIFISFVMENCVNLRKLLPEQEIQYLCDRKELDDNTINIMKEKKLDLDARYTSISKEDVEFFHKNGIKVNCWTCDTKEEAEKLVEYDVDFITSNILE